MTEHGWNGSLYAHVPVCACGKIGAWDEAHDAYYCPESGVWLEPL